MSAYRRLRALFYRRIPYDERHYAMLLSTYNGKYTHTLLM